MKTGPYLNRSMNRSTRTPFCGRIPHMRAWIAVACLSLAACSSSPTAPTAPVAVTPTPVAVIPAPVTPTPTPAPTPSTPAPNPLLSDPRFNLAFYRMMVLGSYEIPGSLQPLRRPLQAPRVYIRTVDEAGASIDTNTLNQTAAAIESITGKLTGGNFGVAGIERGTGTHINEDGWITVRWAAEAWEIDAQTSRCGVAGVNSGLVTLYPKSRACRCAGGPLVMLSIVKHEFGHALGYYHTDNPSDLMYASHATCDQEPSDRELFHAKVAYSQPNGSRDPS